MKTMEKIDPRMFITHPYITCPKCKREDSFGVLMITGSHYTRRCRECWFDETYKLPEIQKKIIYLDQFAISELMKVADKSIGKQEKLDPFWRILYDKLDSLVRMQLIICPNSNFQQEESLLYTYYQALKKMYEHFSYNTSFLDSSTIKRFQLVDIFQEINGIERNEGLSAKHVLDSRVFDWQDRFIISVNFDYPQKEIELAKEQRNKIFDGLAVVFQRWQGEKDKKFDDWYREEALSWGKAKITKYVERILRQRDYLQSGSEMTNDEMIASAFSEESSIISSLMVYAGNGLSTEEKIKKVLTFLLSEQATQAPFNKIGSLLWACLAHQAAHGGRKEPPNIGMGNDIEMISTLLPYCDAMLVDGEMYNLLNQGMVKKQLEMYKTNIYSIGKSYRDSFIGYLDDIYRNASKEHIDKLTEVYGKDCINYE